MSEFRRRLLMQSKSLLPSGYQRVEYIESQGAQRITLDYIVQENDEIYLQYEFIGFMSNDNHFYHATNGNLGVWFDFNSRNLIFYRFGDSSSFNSPLNTSQYIGFSILKKGSLQVNDNTYSISYNGMPNNTLKLFASLSTQGNWLNFSKYKMFDFHISENGTKKLHLIPCYRKSDGEIGLYDIINGKFYTNLGTGEFLKGPDV